MNKSASIGNVASALIKFQASPFAKDATNTFHKNKYVTLDTLLEAVRPHLDAVGLSLSSWMDSEGGVPGLSTLLVHAESGEWVESFFPYAHLDQFKGSSPAQAAGIWTTYTRRYALSAVLNLPGEKDDDGGSVGMSAAAKPTKGSGKDAAARPAGWRGALAECKNMDDITRLFKGVSAGMDKDSDAYAQLVNDCAERKAQVEG